MSEQDIEMQILEELQKLKDVAQKVRDAESAYRNSSELLDKAIKQYHDLSVFKEELDTHVNTTRESLNKTISIWGQAYTQKIDYLNEGFVKLNNSLQKDVNEKFKNIDDQLLRTSNELASITQGLTELKKQQEKNAIAISLGFILILIIGFVILVFRWHSYS